MNTEYLRKMVQDCARQAKPGERPRTILLTPDDAKLCGLPSWVSELWGLKVIIAINILESKVVTHMFNTIQMKTKPDEKKLAEYQEYVIRKHMEAINERDKSN
jgi:hypothetical protein